MVREVLGVLAGIVAWAVIATLLNLPLRMLSPEYAAVEKAMTFTLWMMVARLGLSAVASVGAGFVAAKIGRRLRRPAVLTGLVLFALFAPFHVHIWTQFPAWYHLTFLCSLLILPVLGAQLTTTTHS